MGYFRSLEGKTLMCSLYCQDKSMQAGRIYVTLLKWYSFLPFCFPYNPSKWLLFKDITIFLLTGSILEPHDWMIGWKTKQWCGEALETNGIRMWPENELPLTFPGDWSVHLAFNKTVCLLELQRTGVWISITQEVKKIAVGILTSWSL